ncbi:PQQ-dependent sugar dehydrogenase [Alcanivorax quisquiliarum]|uniref:PQQ-dependent sugar dehydrogenase n=1 Tax=Alcanivorax quisquiliarum TaxID=2933565 RepID=A0ABT0E8D1_9GAMM|nr:PQQ-dependent sugar dehydrogenase [Alcanivorax quisquiliarum]MCK0538089.1 PQQ-dependent sugar dehydrogenase [Alcanivorax quisquiliarum]
MIPLRYSLILAAALGLLAACSDNTDSPETSTAAETATTETPSAIAPAAPEAAPAEVTPEREAFNVIEVARFDSPWAMTFLPDGRLLVTEMAGELQLYDIDNDHTGTITGVPEVEHVAQGGLGDVVLHPDFEDNKLVYISFVEADESGLGAAVARAELALDDEGGGALENLEVIWRQTPKKSGDGHFGYRIAFDDDGMLWISSSERKEFDPAQDMNTNLGKIVRLNDDGSVPEDNPFADQGDIAAQIWSLGHRNILGMAFDADGRLWAHEMGPKDGDELNLIERGGNYGYPLVSNGNHYDDTPIPDHSTRPEFNAPVITWTPVISPAGFIIYDGDQFPDWHGSGFIGGMSSMALVRVEFDGENAREAERFEMQRRIREVEQGPEGAIWLLEDGTRGGGSALLKLTPAE